MEPLIAIFERYKLALGLGFVGLVLIIGGLVSGSFTKGDQNYPKESLIQANSPKKIKVDVSGAVQRPGVYELAEGARVEEAISSAGGFTETANQDYITKNLNLASKLIDGSKVYIPRQGENVAGIQAVGGGSSISGSSIVNINTASQAELEALPGIGSVTAAKIISDRPYAQVEDLLTKKVVGKSVYDKIKDQISVN